MLLQAAQLQFLGASQPHQPEEVPLLERQEVLEPLAFDPRMFVEMRQNEIAWLDRRNKKPVREQQMSAKLGDVQGSGARGVVVMPWAEVVLVE